ncbi:MAG TPA: thioredoxin family protein [Thermoanaerobaculia bacterium]|nr:thioredoxin family protein [Thermoanaerobaculia bacterium]
MECPKCGVDVSQRDAVECPHCGVILSKASSYIPPRNVDRPLPVAAQPAPKSSISGGGIFWIAAAVVVVWFGWRGVSHKTSGVAAGTWYLGASGYDRAISEQKENSKPVLVYFHTDWCGYCKLLENNVFSTSTFQTRYSTILKVKVNPEEGSAERDLAERFSVRGYPTVCVVANGSARQPIVGYAPPDEYYEALKSSIGD